MNSKTVVCLLFFLILMTRAKCQDRALFFAVNEYDDMRDLSNPIKNARSIAAELKENYSFETEVLENPTLDQIEQKLRRYSTAYQKNDFNTSGQLLIYFSGHGVREYKNGFFMPKDGDADRLNRTALSYEYWRPFIDAIPFQHILVSIDACFSGTFDPDWYSMNGSNLPVRENWGIEKN